MFLFLQKTEIITLTVLIIVLLLPTAAGGLVDVAKRASTESKYTDSDFHADGIVWWS